MKRILSASLLMVAVLVGQSVNAAKYWVENKTGKEQSIFFAHTPCGEISNTLTIAPGETKEGFSKKVYYIVFNNKMYNNINSLIPKEQSSRNACDKSIFLDENWWNGFKIVPVNTNGDSILMKDTDKEPSRLEGDGGMGKL